MNNYVALKIFFVILSSITLNQTIESDAHRDGCHSHHSCPSDSGSYVCGDKGYCSECFDNEYCFDGEPIR